METDYREAVSETDFWEAFETFRRIPGVTSAEYFQYLSETPPTVGGYRFLSQKAYERYLKLRSEHGFAIAKIWWETMR